MKKKAKEQIKVQKHTQMENVKQLLVRRETIIFRANLCFTTDILFFFVLPRYLRDVSANWREILHHGL